MVNKDTSQEAGIPVPGDKTTNPPVTRAQVRSIFKPVMQPIRMITRFRTFESLQYRNFLLLCTSTLLLGAGYWIHLLVVGWLTYDISKSPLLTGLAMGLDSMPLLFGGPLGGVLADKWDTRKLLIVTFAYQTLITLGFSAVVILGYTNTYYVLAYIFAMGFSWTIYDPARFSLMPRLVPKQGLVNAVALDSLAFSGTRLIIPAIAGVLIGLLGPGKTMWLGGGMYLGGLVAVFFINPSSTQPSKKTQTSSIALLLEGAKYVVQTPLVLGLILVQAFFPFFILPTIHSQLPVYAAEVFHVGPAGLGILMSGIGAGAIIGTVVMASLGDLKNKGRLVVYTLFATVGLMVVFAFSRSFTLAVPVLVLYSAISTAPGVLQFAMIQTIVPERLRGRVFALNVVAYGFFAVTGMVFGGVAEALGAPNATLIASAITLTAVVYLVLKYPQVWRFK